MRDSVQAEFLQQLSLIAETGDQVDQLQALAVALQLPVELASNMQTPSRYQLFKTVHRLELRETGKGAPGPVFIDFLSGKAAHRRQFGGGRGQPLARAIGLKKGMVPRVLDATAGLGRDAFVLATLGCAVTMVERSPIIHALLADAIARAHEDTGVREITDRLRLIHADASVYMDALVDSLRPDVVYLDPMYPHREKTALVKKEMRLFRHIVGDDRDGVRLLESARKCARMRVAVKRPINAEPLGNQPADALIKSPNTRYDLYFSHH
ncbi:MAG: 16S rRNA methyltransferase [Sedimenticola sp.]|nr:MAG: 16S rRNA methyltransferase [Sedimenticola sp.]